MKRLIKAEATTYTLESNMIAREYYTGENFENEYTIDSYFSYNQELIEAVENDMQEMGPAGLAEYLDYDYLKLEPGIINSIIITIKDYKANAIVKANRELTTDELNSVKDYIIGQYADGWGEGFEQYPIETYNDEYEYEYEEEDEETGDIDTYTDYETQRVEVCVSFWGRGINYNWV